MDGSKAEPHKLIPVSLETLFEDFSRTAKTDIEKS